MNVPFAKGSSTSKAAAAGMRGTVQIVRFQVLDTIKEMGGATCDEVEQLLDLSHQTASARIYDLRHGGEIVDSGLTRLTRTNRKAVVWTTPEQMEKLDG